MTTRMRAKRATDLRSRAATITRATAFLTQDSSRSSAGRPYLPAGSEIVSVVGEEPAVTSAWRPVAFWIAAATLAIWASCCLTVPWTPPTLIRTTLIGAAASEVGKACSSAGSEFRVVSISGGSWRYPARLASGWSDWLS